MRVKSAIMRKFIVGVAVSVALVPGVAVAETSEAQQTSVSFFCNQTADVPETVLIAEQDKAIVIEPILVWTQQYFVDREVTLDLCRESATRLQSLQTAGEIGEHVFFADREGDSTRVCLKTDDGIERCQAESVIFTAALSTDKEPKFVLYEMIPPNTREPLTRGDFPTIHPAFPFSFSSFFRF